MDIGMYTGKGKKKLFLNVIFRMAVVPPLITKDPGVGKLEGKTTEQLTKSLKQLERGIEITYNQELRIQKIFLNRV